MTKLYIQDREPIFCSNVPMVKFFKTKLDSTPKLKILLFLLLITPLKSLVLLTFLKMAKRFARHKSKKPRLDIKVDLYKYWDFLCFRMQVKTQFSLSQNNCLVIENHLTVAPLWKAGIPDNDSPYYIEHTCTPAAQSADPSEPIPTVSTTYIPLSKKTYL